MLDDSAGAALLRVRIDQPACGKFLRRPVADGLELGLAGAGGQPHLVGMFDQAARLDQPGGAQARRVDTISRGAKPKPSDTASGSVTSLARSSKVALPSFSRSPSFRSEPFEQQVGRGGAEDAGFLAEQILPGQLRLGLQRAIERIGVVDRLGLDQRLVGAVFQPRHRAHVGAVATRAQPVEEGRFRPASPRAG